jgi:hypothetical protein
MPIWWKEIGLSVIGKREKLQKEPEADYDRGLSTIGTGARARRISFIGANRAGRFGRTLAS